MNSRWGLLSKSCKWEEGITKWWGVNCKMSWSFTCLWLTTECQDKSGTSEKLQGQRTNPLLQLETSTPSDQNWADPETRSHQGYSWPQWTDLSPKICTWQISTWKILSTICQVATASWNNNRYHYAPVRMAKIQNTDNAKGWQDVEQQELSRCWWVIIQWDKEMSYHDTRTQRKLKMHTDELKKLIRKG
jgi:hypothetical protein